MEQLRAVATFAHIRGIHKLYHVPVADATVWTTHTASDHHNNDTCNEVTFRISVVMCNTFLYYINTMYTVQYVHINCLSLNQHLIHLLYIPSYIIFSYAFRRASASFSGVSNCSIFGP
jgi:hypothetical protein